MGRPAIIPTRCDRCLAGRVPWGALMSEHYSVCGCDPDRNEAPGEYHLIHQPSRLPQIQGLKAHSSQRNTILTLESPKIKGLPILPENWATQAQP